MSKIAKPHCNLPGIVVKDYSSLRGMQHGVLIDINKDGGTPPGLGVKNTNDL